MRDIDLKEWISDSMNALHFSDKTKKRLADTLIRANNGGIPMEKRHMKKTAVLALAAVTATGILSAGAAYWAGNWSRSLEYEMHTTEEQRQQAEKSGLAVRPDNIRATGEITRAVCNGVTITAQQTIVDRYCAMLSFRIDGYMPPAGQDPDIGSLRITVDGKDDISWSGGFYNGLVAGENGRPVYTDGSPLRFNPDGSIQMDYAAEDGSLEYEISLVKNEDPGYFFGKEIEVGFDGLGTGDKAEYAPVLEGTWNLRWTLQGSDAIRIVQVNREIGDSGVILTEAEISPISLRAVLKTDGLWTGYETLETFEPNFTGVRLKDGTLYPYLFMGPGQEGYIDQEECLYEMQFAIDRILNPDDVDALLFIRSVPEGEQPLTAENLYIVPIS